MRVIRLLVLKVEYGLLFIQLSAQERIWSTNRMRQRISLNISRMPTDIYDIAIDVLRTIQGSPNQRRWAKWALATAGFAVASGPLVQAGIARHDWPGLGLAAVAEIAPMYTTVKSMIFAWRSQDDLPALKGQGA